MWSGCVIVKGKDSKNKIKKKFDQQTRVPLTSAPKTTSRADKCPQVNFQGGQVPPGQVPVRTSSPNFPPASKNDLALVPMAIVVLSIVWLGILHLAHTVFFLAHVLLALVLLSLVVLALVILALILLANFPHGSLHTVFTLPALVLNRPITHGKLILKILNCSCLKAICSVMQIQCYSNFASLPCKLNCRIMGS